MAHRAMTADELEIWFDKGVTDDLDLLRRALHRPQRTDPRAYRFQQALRRLRPGLSRERDDWTSAPSPDDQRH